MEKILNILKEVRDDVDFVNEKKLIDDEVIDSFDVVAIVGELCEQYKVTITVDDLTADNFNSAEAMLALVNRLQKKL